MTRTLILAAAGLAGATLLQAQSPTVRVGGLVQAYYSAAHGDSSPQFTPGAPASLFETRRMRLYLDGRGGDAVTFQLATDFASGNLRLLTAWARVLLAHDASSGVGLTVGQEKKPFERLQLTASSSIVSIERGARFRGLTHAAALDNILYQNGYVALDIGASLDAYLLRGRLALKAGVYNGTGESAPDVNTAKTYAGRAALTVASDRRGRPLLRGGLSLVSRDRGIVADTACAADCAFAADSSRRTGAWGVDLEWGDSRPGLHVIADFATGEQVVFGRWHYDSERNLGNLYAGAPDSAFSTFRGIQAVASWRWDVGGREPLVRSVEPAVRVDFTDPDVDRPDDGGRLLTGVLNLHFTPTTVLRAGADWYHYGDGPGVTHDVYGARVSWQVAF